MTKIYINADGGSRGNPGPAAIGVVILDENKKVLETCKEKIGIASNNVAEYKALIKGLTLAAKHPATEVFVMMDSELVVRQMSGEYKVKAKHLLPLHNEAKEKAKKLGKVVYINVLREYNAHADMLVNEALDEK
jgi:ribonuclease HI